MCDLYDRVPGWWPGAVPALHAHVPHRMYRRLAHEELHMPQLHGASGCCSPSCLRRQLVRGVQCNVLQCECDRLNNMWYQTFFNNNLEHFLSASWSSVCQLSSGSVVQSTPSINQISQKFAPLWLWCIKNIWESCQDHWTFRS